MMRRHAFLLALFLSVVLTLGGVALMLGGFFIPDDIPGSRSGLDLARLDAPAAVPELGDADAKAQAGALVARLEPSPERTVSKSLRVTWRLRLLDATTGLPCPRASLWIAEEDQANAAFEHGPQANISDESSERWRCYAWCRRHGTKYATDENGRADIPADPELRYMLCASSSSGDKARSVVLSVDDLESEVVAGVEDALRDGGQATIDVTVTLHASDHIEVTCVDRRMKAVVGMPFDVFPLSPKALTAFDERVSPVADDDGRIEVQARARCFSDAQGQLTVPHARQLLDDVEGEAMNARAVPPADEDTDEDRVLAAVLIVAAAPFRSTPHILLRYDSARGFGSRAQRLAVDDYGTIELRVVAADGSPLEFAMLSYIEFEPLRFGKLTCERGSIEVRPAPGRPHVYSHVGVASEFLVSAHGVDVGCDAGGELLGPSRSLLVESRVLRLPAEIAIAWTVLRGCPPDVDYLGVLLDGAHPFKTRVQAIEGGRLYFALRNVWGATAKADVAAWIMRPPRSAGGLENVSCRPGTVTQWPDLVLGQPSGAVVGRCVDTRGMPVPKKSIAVAWEAGQKRHTYIPGCVATSASDGSFRMVVPDSLKTEKLILVFHGDAHHSAVSLPLVGPEPRTLELQEKAQIDLEFRAPSKMLFTCVLEDARAAPNSLERQYQFKVSTSASGLARKSLGRRDAGPLKLTVRSPMMLGVIEKCFEPEPGASERVIVDVRQLHHYDIQWFGNEAPARAPRVNLRLRSRDSKVVANIVAAAPTSNGKRLSFWWPDATLDMTLSFSGCRSVERVWTPGQHQLTLEPERVLRVEASSANFARAQSVVVRAVSTSVAVDRDRKSDISLKPLAVDPKDPTRLVCRLHLSDSDSYNLDVRVDGAPFQTVASINPLRLPERVVLDSSTSAHMEWSR